MTIVVHDARVAELLHAHDKTGWAIRAQTHHGADFALGSNVYRRQAAGPAGKRRVRCEIAALHARAFCRCRDTS